MLRAYSALPSRSNPVKVLVERVHGPGKREPANGVLEITL